MTMTEWEHQQQVKEIYESLSENEKAGVQYGLFPYRILPAQLRKKVSIEDLMEYDKAVRAASQ